MAAAAVILELLSLMQADPQVADRLTTYGDGQLAGRIFNVKPWHAPGRSADLWRLRRLKSAATKYRVIYGYNWPTRELVVLAIVDKAVFDYDDLGSQLSKRILGDWRDLIT